MRRFREELEYRERQERQRGMSCPRIDVGCTSSIMGFASGVLDGPPMQVVQGTTYACDRAITRSISDINKITELEQKLVEKVEQKKVDVQSVISYFYKRK